MKRNPLQFNYLIRVLRLTFEVKNEEDMTKEMTIEQKKEYAKLIFLKENCTQKDIAERVGVSAVTINKWVKDWENLKLNLLQTREERINSTLQQLDELDRCISGREEGFRFPSKEEARIRRSLTADLEALEQEASIRDIYNVSRKVLDWLRVHNLEEAQRMSDYFDSYIKEQMKWAK